MNNDNFKKIIKEICIEHDIKCSFLSKDWVIMLEKDGKTRFISGYKFDSNLHGVGSVADDKYALYEVLKAKTIPVAEHKIVYAETNKLDYAVGCNTREYVKEYFIKNNNHIVIKPNCGTCGNNVFNVTNIDEIDDILSGIFASNYSISICPFYEIKHEYRVVMLEGKKELLYAKYLPKVIGDGKKTIRQLLFEFNYGYFVDKLDDAKYDRVLANKEVFIYNWKFNLSQGSVAREVSDEMLVEKLTNLAEMVCKELNIGFASIDIIQTRDDALLVLEVNSGVMLENYVDLVPDGYKIAKRVYEKAVIKLFE